MEKNDSARGKLPKPFVIRRLHSILGLWLVVYLCEHLLVNSQMALVFQDEGSSFIRLVDKIHDLPFLRLVELLFIGLPFVIHGLYGILYARRAKTNTWPSGGIRPNLIEYRRNRAFTWQRITSWALIPLILIHVIQMRFIEYPQVLKGGAAPLYAVNLHPDPQLASLAQKIHVSLEEKEGRVVGFSDSIGKAFLLVLRETFKNPLWNIFYSLLVIASTYHAFNGLFTLLISWGILLTQRAQKLAKGFTNIVLWITTVLGLGAVWGTYLTLLVEGAL